MSLQFGIDEAEDLLCAVACDQQDRFVDLCHFCKWQRWKGITREDERAKFRQVLAEVLPGGFGQLVVGAFLFEVFQCYAQRSLAVATIESFPSRSPQSVHLIGEELMRLRVVPGPTERGWLGQDERTHKVGVPQCEKQSRVSA